MKREDCQHIMTLLSNVPMLKELKLPTFHLVNLDLLDAVEKHDSLSSLVAWIPATMLSNIPPHNYGKLSLGQSSFIAWLEYYRQQKMDYVRLSPTYLTAFSSGLDVRKIFMTIQFANLNYFEIFAALSDNALRHLHAIQLEFDTDEPEDSCIFNFEKWLASAVRYLPSLNTLFIHPINRGFRTDLPLALLHIYGDDRIFIESKKHYVHFELERIDVAQENGQAGANSMDFREYWKAHWVVSFLALKYRGKAEEFKELRSLSYACQSATRLEVRFKDAITLSVRFNSPMSRK